MDDSTRVMVLGADGYIGFPLSMSLACKGYEVIGVDALLRRKWVAEIGSHSATLIQPVTERLLAFKKTFDRQIQFEYGNLMDYSFVSYLLREYRPDVIIHLAEQPSAPFSMMGVEKAALTQSNNLIGTLNLLYAIKESVPDCHLIKLGSMGEYGSTNTQIPEGFFELSINGHSESMLFPRHAFPDWYHWSKVYDSGNIMMACEIWGLKSSDIMQGIVYGTRTEQIVREELHTRFDFDSIFGTVLNRFCAQTALGYNLTTYGTGMQKRPLISLRDTIQCLALVLENPPARGEYRVFNQFSDVYTICDIARAVSNAGNCMGLETTVEHCENPRKESEDTPHYQPVCEKLYKLGFQVSYSLEEELDIIISDLLRFRERIASREHLIQSRIQWDSKPVNFSAAK